jgi:hypothetical protein
MPVVSPTASAHPDGEPIGLKLLQNCPSKIDEMTRASLSLTAAPFDFGVIVDVIFK